MRFNLFLCLSMISLNLFAQEHDHEAMQQVMQAQSTQLPGDTMITEYRCPMHSHITSHEPGNCPICGMALEPVNTPKPGQQVEVKVSGQIQQQMNIQVQPVGRGAIWKYIQTLGQVQVAEPNLTHVHTRVSGWIETLHVDKQGQHVQVGDLLFRLYSPDLIVAQDDFLQALNAGLQQSNPALFKQARRRLTLLGISEKVITELESRKMSFESVPFYATSSGVVSHLNVRPGMFVKPERDLLTIVDLTEVWLVADIFEPQFSWVSVGTPADVHIDAMNIDTLESEVDYIYPQLDSTSHTLRVRFKLDNPHGLLLPGMLANVDIYGGPKRDVLRIPSQALITTQNSQRVVVRQADDTFVLRELKTGVRTTDWIEVIDGLSEGESLVVSGQFLLDSEANLQSQRANLTSHHQH